MRYKTCTPPLSFPTRTYAKTHSEQKAHHALEKDLEECGGRTIRVRDLVLDIVGDEQGDRKDCRVVVA